MCASILGLAIPAAAHQPVDGDIHAAFGWMGYQTEAIDHYWKPQLLVSPGLIVEGDLNSYGGLEIAFFYLQNPFSVKEDGRVLTEKVKRMYISMGYRYWFNVKYSAAVGFFSSYSMGSPRTVHDEFGVLEHPTTSASDTTEYGFDVSVQYEPWHKDRAAFVIDGRYSYSVTPKKHEDSNHYGVLFAFKYFVQARERPPE